MFTIKILNVSIVNLKICLVKICHQALHQESEEDCSELYFLPILLLNLKRQKYESIIAFNASFQLDSDCADQDNPLLK